MINLDEIERLANAATPGPWDAECDDGEGEVVVNAGTARTMWSANGIGVRASSWRYTDRIMTRDDLWDADFEHASADAEFIAATGPDVTLALIVELRVARACIEKIRELPVMSVATAGGGYMAVNRRSIDHILAEYDKKAES